MKARIIRSINYSLIIILFLFSSASYWLLLTHPGAKWVEQRLNELNIGLSLSVKSGSVLQGLKLTQLQWRSPGFLLSIEQVSAQWQLACLIKSEVCVKKLSAKSLTISLLENGEAQETTAGKNKVDLAEISLPFAIAINELKVEKFIWLDGDFRQQLNSIRAVVEMSSTQLSVERFTATYDQFNFELNGNIDFVDDYPLILSAHISEQSLPLNLQLSVAGDLNNLVFSGLSQLPVPLRAEGEISALLLDAYLSLTLKNVESLQIPFGEEYLLIDKATFLAQGSVEDIELELHVVDFIYDDLSSDVDLFAAWQNGTLQISKLNVDNSAGSIFAAGAIDIDTDKRDGVEWDAVLTVSSLDIAQVVNKVELVSHLAGDIKSKGYWKSEQPLSWSLGLTDWRGHFMDQPIVINGALEHGEEGGLLVQQLSVDLAGNKFVADGVFNSEKALHISMDFPALHQLWPGLNGNLAGKFKLRGDINKPSLVGHFSGKNLKYLDFQLQSLAGGLDVKSLAESDSFITIRAEEARIADTAVKQFYAVARGSQHKHNVELEIDLPQLGLVALNCDGVLPVSLEWQGLCRTLSLSPAVNDLPSWHNDNPLQFTWQLEKQSLQLNPFCLSAAEGRLCNEKLITIADQSISGVDLMAESIPMAWFASVLSEDLELKGGSDWRMRLDWSQKAGPVGEMRFQADGTSGNWWLDETHQYPFLFDSLYSLIKFEADQLLIDLNYTSSQLGQLAGKVSVSELAAKRLLEGNITISHFDIAPLAVLDDTLREMAGEINGNIQLGGSLSLPTLKGDLKLSDGRVLSRIIDARFDDIQLDIRFNREIANIDGSLDIDGQELAIAGQMLWPDKQLQSRISLKGESIPFSYDPIEHAKITPNLDIELRHNFFSIEGSVALEDVLIRMERLPQNAYSESEDVQFVEQALNEEIQPELKVKADLRLELGKKVVFRGFGADVELEGNFRYLQKENGYPRGEGEIFVAEGYYTVWGQRLDIREGSFVFGGPIDSPDIKIEAIREIMTEDITVGMRGYGPIQEPTFEVFSEPAMGSERAMHYLLTGRAPDEEASKGSDLLGTAALSAGLSGAEGRAGSIADRFGIDDFQMSTVGGAEGTEVQLSGYINRDLFVRYGMGLFDRANTLTVRYRLRPQLFIESASGLENAVDLIYSFEHD